MKPIILYANFRSFKNSAGETAQGLGALATLSEGLLLIPSTHDKHL